MNQFDQIRFNSQITLYGLKMSDFDFTQMKINDAVSQLGKIKKAVHKGFRKFAMGNHPDQGGDEEKFKQMAAAKDVIMGIKIKVVQPPPVVRYFHFNVSRSYSSSTASSTTTGGFY
jgi:hypothetical protein